MNASPTQEPSNYPTTNPTNDPLQQATEDPSTMPTVSPTINPSAIPTRMPSIIPSVNPATYNPTSNPTQYPSSPPSVLPSAHPITLNPTSNPLMSETTTEYFISFRIEQNVTDEEIGEIVVTVLIAEYGNVDLITTDIDSDGNVLILIAISSNLELSEESIQNDVGEALENEYDEEIEVTVREKDPDESEEDDDGDMTSVFIVTACGIVVFVTTCALFICLRCKMKKINAQNQQNESQIHEEMAVLAKNGPNHKFIKDENDKNNEEHNLEVEVEGMPPNAQQSMDEFEVVGDSETTKGATDGYGNDFEVIGNDQTTTGGSAVQDEFEVVGDDETTKGEFGGRNDVLHLKNEETAYI